ncbi:MAG: hypothetical protein AAGN15_09165 [Cyanobacteria bacterium J06581_3]
MRKLRLLLLIENRENLRLLTSRLSAQFELITPPRLPRRKPDQSGNGQPAEGRACAISPDITVEDFDLIICDLINLGQWGGEANCLATRCRTRLPSCFRTAP